MKHIQQQTFWPGPRRVRVWAQARTERRQKATVEGQVLTSRTFPEWSTAPPDACSPTRATSHHGQRRPTPLFPVPLREAGRDAWRVLHLTWPQALVLVSWLNRVSPHSGGDTSGTRKVTRAGFPLRFMYPDLLTMHQFCCCCRFFDSLICGKGPPL